MSILNLYSSDCVENSIFLNEIECLKLECFINLEEYNFAKKLAINIKENTQSKELATYCENILKEIYK